MCVCEEGTEWRCVKGRKNAHESTTFHRSITATPEHASCDKSSYITHNQLFICRPGTPIRWRSPEPSLDTPYFRWMMKKGRLLVTFSAAASASFPLLPLSTNSSDSRQPPPPPLPFPSSPTSPPAVHQLRDMSTVYIRM